ncbi:BLUF domain-containing protein [Marivirga arenosa]|uniref:BLUF domain-containing protein n=1 Tax=Marivirga arenosa TaxID=3059076 RepID=A0AA49JDC1_9BACT|nr:MULTISPECIES: BLUF domain-containing protein [unclassified Marivirga]WKK80683.1 BLUF domain-containing protein [Marivirga sp. BKB1-2]WKK84338.1 BLUF domain-containing protein [Marivirga sp. ABR2-2]
MLSNLIYVSKRKSNCTEEEIKKILDSCERNNSGEDITGVLLYSKDSFVQYLEGEYKKIFELYDKIKLDDRHKEIRLINSSPIKEKVFPSWHMGAKKLDFSNIEFKTDITEKDKGEFNKILNGENSPNSVELLKKVFN